MRSLTRLTRWPLSDGIVIFINGRVFPALLSLYAAGTAAVAAGNLEVVAALLRGRLPRSTEPYARREELLAVPLVLNGPEVLDSGEINRVLNIGAKGTTRYHAPVSLFLQRVLRPLLVELIPGEEEFEAAFDTFEALLGLRYITEGEPGLPAGSYNYRGKRSFMLPGVPERLKAELERDGESWPPVAGKVFDSANEAASAIEAMVERLAGAAWESFS